MAFMHTHFEEVVLSAGYTLDHYLTRYSPNTTHEDKEKYVFF